MLIDRLCGQSKLDRLSFGLRPPYATARSMLLKWKNNLADCLRPVACHTAVLSHLYALLRLVNERYCNCLECVRLRTTVQLYLHADT